MSLKPGCSPPAAHPRRLREHGLVRRLSELSTGGGLTLHGRHTSVRRSGAHDNTIAIPIALPLAVSGTSFLIIFHLLNVLKQMEDQNYIRESVSKKSMPLHLLLQFSLVIGFMLQ